MALTQALIDGIETAFDINGDKQNEQIRTAFESLLDGGGGRTIYKAYLTQVGVLAPTEDDIDGGGGSPFVDSIGGAWSYVGVGTYRYTKVGAFTDPTKINVEFSNSQGDQGNDVVCSSAKNDNDSIDIFVGQVASFGVASTNADGVMYKQGITIEVYA